MAEPLHLSSARGSDQSRVDQRNFVSLRIGVTPGDMKIITRAAKERGMSRAELLRSMIRSLAARP